MELLIDVSSEDLEREITRCDDKIDNSTANIEKSFWNAEKRFYSLIIKAKQRGIHRSETLLVEADQLFRKRMMLKISTEDSAVMCKAAILMLDALLN